MVLVLSVMIWIPILQAGSSGPILNPDNGHYYEWYDDGNGYGFIGARHHDAQRGFGRATVRSRDRCPGVDETARAAGG